MGLKRYVVALPAHGKRLVCYIADRDGFGGESFYIGLKQKKGHQIASFCFGVE